MLVLVVVVVVVRVGVGVGAVQPDTGEEAQGRTTEDIRGDIAALGARSRSVGCGGTAGVVAAFAVAGSRAGTGTGRPTDVAGATAAVRAARAARTTGA